MKQPSLVFVCQNLRDPDAPQGSCMRRGSREVLDHLKQLRGELGLKTELRVMGCTCLGPCESGVNVLVVDDRRYRGVQAVCGRGARAAGEAGGDGEGGGEVTFGSSTYTFRP